MKILLTLAALLLAGACTTATDTDRYIEPQADSQASLELTDPEAHRIGIYGPLYETRALTTVAQNYTFKPPRNGRLYDSCFKDRNGRVDCSENGRRAAANGICRDLGYDYFLHVWWYTGQQPMRDVWIMREHPYNNGRAYRESYRGAFYVTELVCERYGFAATAAE